MRYINRNIEPLILKASTEFPALAVTGPRQSGKTTLLKRLFADTHKYVSLDLPDVAASATVDPRGFLAQYSAPVILDEIQYVPGLLPYIKEDIDTHRDVMGAYVLTGSQNLMLAENVTESLAGRAAMLRLMPLSAREARGIPQAAFPWEPKYDSGAITKYPRSRLWRDMLRGGYPELAANPGRDAALWQGSYIQTYIERDVRSLRQIGSLTDFQGFLHSIATRSGQLLNLADVSRDLGVSYNTAKQWLAILEATFQVVILKPYHVNLGKRLVKTPKVYVTDTGILCYLTRLTDPESAAAGPLAGPIFETAVLLEIIKTMTNRGDTPRVYFWRTSYGAEVDIVVEWGDRLVPIEVKTSATPRAGMTSGLRAFLELYGRKADKGYMVHTGDIRLPLGQGIQAIPFADL